MTPLPKIRDLILIGGGHAHALVLRMWAMNPLPGTQVTLINPDPVAPYTGMLPGLIAGHYQREELMIDLVRLARFAEARLILDRVTGIDVKTQRIHLEGQASLPFDLASVNVGITTDVPDLPGASEHARAAKPLGAYAASWEDFLARDLALPRVTILGSGLGGVELALASAHRLQRLGKTARITLLDRTAAPLPGLAPSAQARVLRHLEAMGVVLRLNADVTHMGPESVFLSTGEEIGSDFTLTATGARPLPWLAQSGLAHDGGFLVTDATLRTSHQAIFAAGDCANIAGAPRPRAGVFAVRAAPVLLHNLRATLAGQSLRRFRPQADYLKLISLGDKLAVAEKWGISLAGNRLWQLKDRIDRRFMNQFGTFPPMAALQLPAVATKGLSDILRQRPLCGGCGAKLGPGVLSSALTALPDPERAEVYSAIGDDAAVLKASGGLQVLTTDHLRAFSHDPRLMARIAALHAMGDIWAMGAQPQVALAQVILPRLGPELQERMLQTVMDEAGRIFRAAGADVVGGHSSEGSELTIGFTVTGTAERTIGKGGAKAGDVLILTKPLGSGTILAAEMAMATVPGRLTGEIWAACIAQMSRSQSDAAALLAPQAHAMTDVTGFGLAGHLLEMLELSGTAATVRLDFVPLMVGAQDLTGSGYASSLLPSNLASVSWRMTAPSDPRTALLSDPQTAGGLLAAVPQKAAAGLLAGLLAAGHTAAIIGEVTEGKPHLTVAL